MSGKWAESSTPEPAGCSADPGRRSASNHNADQGPEDERCRQGRSLGAPPPQPAAPEPAPPSDGGGAKRVQPLLPGQVSTAQSAGRVHRFNTQQNTVVAARNLKSHV